MKEFFWSLGDRHVTYVEENKILGVGQAALRGSRKSSQQETCEHVQEQLEHSWSTAGQGLDLPVHLQSSRTFLAKG